MASMLYSVRLSVSMLVTKFEVLRKMRSVSTAQLIRAAL